MATIFRDLLKKNGRASQIQSDDWYNLKTQQVSDKDDVLQNTISRTFMAPGFMYMFHYIPKNKNTLDVYDVFPLVFPFKKLSNGFLGINLNYLSKSLRAKLLDELNNITLNKDYDEALTFRLTYYLLQRLSQQPEYKPYIRHYLNSQVKSRYIVIPPVEWANVLYLTSREMQDETKQTVVKETKHIIER